MMPFLVALLLAGSGYPSLNPLPCNVQRLPDAGNGLVCSGTYVGPYAAPGSAFDAGSLCVTDFDCDLTAAPAFTFADGGSVTVCGQSGVVPLNFASNFTPAALVPDAGYVLNPVNNISWNGSTFNAPGLAFPLSGFMVTQSLKDPLYVDVWVAASNASSNNSGFGAMLWNGVSGASGESSWFVLKGAYGTGSCSGWWSGFNVASVSGGANCSASSVGSDTEAEMVLPNGLAGIAMFATAGVYPYADGGWANIALDPVASQQPSGNAQPGTWTGARLSQFWLVIGGQHNNGGVSGEYTGTIGRVAVRHGYCPR